MSLNILMIVPQYPPPVAGGLEKQAHILSKGLKARKHNIKVISYSNGGTAKKRIFDEIEVFEVGPRGKNFLFSVFTWCKLFARLWKLTDNADVVHVHVPSWFGAVSLLVSQWRKTPTLFKLSNVGELGIPGLQLSLSGRLRLSVILKASGIVAMTEQSVSELKFVGYPMQNVLFRPNGIEVEECLSERTVKDEALNFVYLGRLSAEKSLPDLLLAWSISEAHLKGSKLIFAGDGPDEAALINLAQNLNITDSVKFLGHVRDVKSLLEHNDVFVLPSSLEGNSNAVLEAMAAGMPIISTNISGTKMQVGQEGYPLLYDPGDVSTLAYLINDITRCKKTREKIGSQMRIRVEKIFSMGEVVNDYIEAYGLLLDETLGKLSSVNSAEQF